MNGAYPAFDWRTFGEMLALLFVVGIGYNWLMGKLQNRAGYTAFYVAGGVLITLGGVAIVFWQAALLTLAAFVASGTPMIIGSMYRYMRETAATLEALRRVMHDD